MFRRVVRTPIATRSWLIPVLWFLSHLALPAAEPVTAPAVETPLERAAALDKGVNGVRDAALTAEAYRLAAESGDAFAHLRLGYLFETGDGGPQDYTQARAHYQAAVNAGLNEARLRLAICFLEGWGGPADRPAFAREMKAAAEANYVPAQQIFAAMCFIGLGVPKDQAQGLSWLERAAAHDDSWAQLQLGRQLEAARRQVLSPDLALVRSWYQLSAEQEYQEGSRAMARTFLMGERKDRNWELGQRWMLLATEMGDPEAPYTLAVFELLHVDAPEHNWEKARGWLKLASERGNERATELLELEKSGRPLDEAAKYILREPFEERYVRKMEASAASNRDKPTHIPEIYRVVTPVYPRGLKLEGVAGEVTVDFIVDVTGRVVNPKAVKSTHPAFADRAVEAVRQWRFYPARKDGHEVRAHMQVPVRFEIAEERLDGLDGMLKEARAYAEELGPEVAADSTELRRGRATTQLPLPTLPDGREIPKGAAGLILIVIDPTGQPIRSHVLAAKPEIYGPIVQAAVMKGRFQPRIEAGQAVQTNVVLPYRFGKFDDLVLPTK